MKTTLPTRPLFVLLAVASAALLAGPTSPDFAALTAAANAANTTTEPIAPGPFSPSWDSLKTYETPDWFRDAKFGIWAHWGPQCQPEMGDWYARKLYQSTTTDKKTGEVRPAPAYQFHVARYGHPSNFGFKDVIHTWEAERWDPVKLMALYKHAGAKYFMALANHHDNFDLWESKYQPWNSTVLGPKKDLIDGWAKAARAQGLRFAVSVHASRAWSWYETAQGADADGPKKDVRYDGRLTAADGNGKWWDGLDPQDLYAQSHPVATPSWEWKYTPPAVEGDPRAPSAAYINKFYNRTVDLINRYNPDAIYFDDTVLPFYPINDVGLKIAAHYYNQSLARHGQVEAAIYGKHLDETQKHSLVYDIERGKAPDILPRPWQTDTCIGDWHYRRGLYENHTYKKSGDVIRMLADIVSKNGNLMLNIPLRGDGTPDPDEVQVLNEIGAWMDVNGQAIYATRPWKVYGDGPSVTATHEKGPFDGLKDVGAFTGQDVRYTVSKDGRTLYAIALDAPGDELRLASLGAKAGLLDRDIRKIEQLGAKSITWTRDDSALVIKPAATAGTPAAVVFKITLGKS
jgi:alpha-L-fucosidase